MDLIKSTWTKEFLVPNSFDLNIFYRMVQAVNSQRFGKHEKGTVMIDEISLVQCGTHMRLSVTFRRNARVNMRVLNRKFRLYKAMNFARIFGKIEKQAKLIAKQKKPLTIC